MLLHLVYRSASTGTGDGRPSYYDERLGLVSFLRAVEAVPGVDLTFINNGPVSADRLELMQRSGAPVHQIDVPGRRPSYRYALRYAMNSDWADDDLVYLVDDDYLHVPGAIAGLDAAMRALPEVSYLLTYGSTRSCPIISVEHLEEARPVGWRPGVPADVEGQSWRQTYAATSTYAVRVGALREDYRITLQSHLPYRHRWLDRESGLVWQGYEPYRWTSLAREAVGLAEGGVRQKVRGVAEAPFKAAFNLRSHRRPGRRRLLYVAEPNLATHLDTVNLAPGRDWEAVARETRAWFETRGRRHRGLALDAEPHPTVHRPGRTGQVPLAGVGDRAGSSGG